MKLNVLCKSILMRAPCGDCERVPCDRNGDETSFRHDELRSDVITTFVDSGKQVSVAYDKFIEPKKVRIW